MTGIMWVLIGLLWHLSPYPDVAFWLSLLASILIVIVVELIKGKKIDG